MAAELCAFVFEDRYCVDECDEFLHERGIGDTVGLGRRGGKSERVCDRDHVNVCVEERVAGPDSLPNGGAFQADHDRPCVACAMNTVRLRRSTS